MAQLQADRPIWTEEGSSKRHAVQRMFDDIAPTYDLLNGLLSFANHHRWRALAVSSLNLKPGDSVLDLCCGTGDFLVPLRKAVGPAGQLLGLDLSEQMLGVAEKKLSEPLAQADACSLPSRSGSFDAVTVGWGIRNVPDQDAAHREIARVLRPGGRFVSIDMARPDSAMVRSASEFMFHRAVPLLGAVFGRREAYTYLPKSTERFMNRDQLEQSMRDAGFSDVGWRDFMFGNICMHWGTKS